MDVKCNPIYLEACFHYTVMDGLQNAVVLQCVCSRESERGAVVIWSVQPWKFLTPGWFGVGWRIHHTIVTAKHPAPHVSMELARSDQPDARAESVTMLS